MSRTRTLVDHDAVWIVLLGATAMAGGRRSRRAALRSAISLVLAGMGAGAGRIVPRSVGGRRPVRSRRCARRRVSTTAAALALAAAVEAPALAVPVVVGMVGTGIRASRRSCPEVLGGVLLGAAAAVTSFAIWPRSSSGPAEATPHRARRSELSSPTGDGVVIVCNESAGPSAHRREIDVIGRELPDAEIVGVADADEIAPALHRAAERARALGVVGGDGTISAAAAAALASGIPLMVVPGGTLNHFARDLGLDDARDAVSAVQAGEILDVDIGVIDGRPFLNTASFGPYSQFVEAREQLERRIGKWPAVVLALWRTVLSSEPVDVTINGRPRRIWTIFVGNCVYDPPGFAPSTRARLDDGKFDVRVIDGTHPAARLRLIVAVLTGRVGRSVVYTRELVERLDVAAEGSGRALAADGEIFDGAHEFTISKHRSALAVYAPHR